MINQNPNERWARKRWFQIPRLRNAQMKEGRGCWRCNWWFNWWLIIIALGHLITHQRTSTVIGGHHLRHQVRTSTEWFLDPHRWRSSWAGSRSNCILTDIKTTRESLRNALVLHLTRRLRWLSAMTFSQWMMIKIMTWCLQSLSYGRASTPLQYHATGLKWFWMPKLGECDRYRRVQTTFHWIGHTVNHCTSPPKTTKKALLSTQLLYLKPWGWGLYSFK